MVKKVGQLLDEVTGDPVAPATPVDIRLISDDSLISTVSTDADGYYSYSANGNPGPTYDEATIGGTTRKNSTKTINGAGPIDLSALRFTLQTFTPGVIYTYPGKMTGEGLTVIANGTNMIVAVDVGASTAYGVTHVQTTTKNITVTTAPVSGTRTDTIIVRHYYNATDEGKTEIIYVADNNSYEPDTNQTVGWRDVHLATITVDAGVTAIAINKVTDRRTYASPQIGTGYIAAHMLASGLGFPQTYTYSWDPVISPPEIDIVVTNNGFFTMKNLNEVLPTGSWSGQIHYVAKPQNYSATVGQTGVFRTRFTASDISSYTNFYLESGYTIDTNTYLAPNNEVHIIKSVVNASGTMPVFFDYQHTAGALSQALIFNGVKIYGTLVRTA